MKSNINKMKKRIMVDMSSTLIHHGHIRLIKKARKYGVGLFKEINCITKRSFTLV